MIDGKNRIIVEWLDAMGRGRAKLFVDVVSVQINEGVLLLHVEGTEFPALGVPVIRLVSLRALKDTEEVADEEGASETGESPEDAQVRDSADA